MAKCKAVTGSAVKGLRKYYQNSSVLDCVTMFTVSSTLMWAVLTGPTDWVCHTGTLTLCLEAVTYSCIIVTWWSGSGKIQAWSQRPTGFLQCFDTVGLVIWPVKIVPKMTYNVLSGTLNPYTTATIQFLLLLFETSKLFQYRFLVNL